MCNTGGKFWAPHATTFVVLQSCQFLLSTHRVCLPHKAATSEPTAARSYFAEYISTREVASSEPEDCPAIFLRRMLSGAFSTNARRPRMEVGDAMKVENARKKRAKRPTQSAADPTKSNNGTKLAILLGNRIPRVPFAQLRGRILHWLWCRSATYLSKVNFARDVLQKWKLKMSKHIDFGNEKAGTKTILRDILLKMDCLTLLCCDSSVLWMPAVAGLCSIPLYIYILFCMSSSTLLCFLLRFTFLNVRNMEGCQLYRTQSAESGL